MGPVSQNEASCLAAVFTGERLLSKTQEIRTSKTLKKIRKLLGQGPIPGSLSAIISTSRVFLLCRSVQPAVQTEVEPAFQPAMQPVPKTSPIIWDISCSNRLSPSIDSLKPRIGTARKIVMYSKKLWTARPWLYHQRFQRLNSAR